LRATLIASAPELRSYDAARARHVLDDERAAEAVRELRGEHAREHVRIAAGRRGGDEPHRLGGIGLLRERRGGEREKRDEHEFHG
jgi:hypothetical protein